MGFAALSAAGFPAGISISQIGVWERGYDDVGDSATSTPIPVVARDVNTNGVFDAGDAITFYARNLRDRVGPASIENRYSYANVYWLTWTGAAAAVPDSISGVIADPSPALPTSFQDTIHLEQNQRLMTWPNTYGGVPDRKRRVHVLDRRLRSGPVQHLDPVRPPRRIGAVPDPSAGTRARKGTTHRLNIFYQSSTGATDTLAASHDFFGREIYLLDTGFTHSRLPHRGRNEPLPSHGIRAVLSGATFFPGSIAFLDWVDVTYSRLYVADLNRLEFTSGATAGIVGAARRGIHAARRSRSMT